MLLNLYTCIFSFHNNESSKTKRKQKTNYSRDAKQERMKEYSEIVTILLNSDATSIARGLLSSLDHRVDFDEAIQKLEKNFLEVSRALTDEISAKSSSIRSSSSSSRSSSSSSNIVIQEKQKSLSHNRCTDINRIDTVHNKSKSSAAYPPLSLEGIRQVAQSGLLNTKEMGRVFFLTSPKITHQIGNEFIWDSLCSSVLPDLALFPTLKTYSNEWIFREFSKPMSVPSSRRQLPSISPAHFQAESVVMYLQWFAARSDPKPIATIEIPIDCLQDLLDKGQATISSCYIPEILFDINTIHKLHTRVVCLRKDRRQCCTLHEGGEYTWDIVDDDDDNDEINHSTETGNLYFGPKNKLALDESGRNIEKRLTVPDRDANGFELLVVAKATRPRDRSTNNCDAYSSWKVCELTLQFWANFNQIQYIFNSQEEVQKNGVTMLHILDQLIGWNG
jgi:hypothetical protein